MSDSDPIAAANVILSKVERLWKIAVGILALTVSGVLWGAKLEWTQQDMMLRMDRAETRVEQHGLDIATLKARRGIAAAKAEAEEPPQNKDF